MFLYLYKYNICSLRKKKISDFCVLDLSGAEGEKYSFPRDGAVHVEKRLSESVQAFDQLLIPINTPDGQEKKHRNGKYKYSRDGMAALIFHKLVYLLQV